MIYLFSKDSTKARPLLSHTSTNNNYFDDFKMLIRDINTTFHERSEDRIVRRNVTKYVAQTTRRRIPRDFQPLRCWLSPTLEGAEVNAEGVHTSQKGETEESGRDDEEKDNDVTIYLAAFFFFFFFLASPSSSVGSAGASSTGGGASSFFSSSLTATKRPTTSLDLIM